MDPATYQKRRQRLRETVKSGVIVIVGQAEAPRNYVANPYPFRQDSHFLYYVGTNLPDMVALIQPDGKEVLFGAPEDPDDLIWHGPHPVLRDHAETAGFTRFEELPNLKKTLDKYRTAGEPIHYLPPYRAERTLFLAELLEMTPGDVAQNASSALARAVVEQRSIKSAEEVAQIENALEIHAKAYQAAFGTIAPGKTEAEVAGVMQGVALRYDRGQAFLPIVTIHGEILHNNDYSNVMNDGDLLLIDSGAESPLFYASDITRTLPVSGQFTEQQKEIYQTVLDAQLAVISAASPRVSNRSLHLKAARTIVDGLSSIGLMKGDPDEAVKAGAHALFFPHGIGHMLGLDVHDMEDLGDVVGYPGDEKRSKQFGLSFLRLAKKLEPGFVITDEPGVYFVPALIDRWAAEKKHESFIDYAKVEQFRSFGGVRIEDDLLITGDGCRVLGPGIPKTIDELESAMANSR